MSTKDNETVPVAPAKPDDGINTDSPQSLNGDKNPEVSNATNGNPQNEGREHTRSQMALLFVLGFFAVLFLCFLYAMMVGSSLSELKEILTAVVGALSGILGFIVGYYYKSNQEQ